MKCTLLITWYIHCNILKQYCNMFHWMKARNVGCVCIWRRGDIFQQSSSHSPAISFMDECVNLRCNLCQSSKAVWHAEEMNILLALQERTNMKNFLHIYILNVTFQMWLHSTQYCDIVPRNCCVYSFIGKNYWMIIYC